jgi:hypothetical protein
MTDVDDELKRLRRQFEQLLPKDQDAAIVDDFWFTEDEDKAWSSAEPSFTKQIVTPLSTKHRLRVTLPKVTSSLRLLAQFSVGVKNRLLCSCD